MSFSSCGIEPTQDAHHCYFTQGAGGEVGVFNPQFIFGAAPGGWWNLTPVHFLRKIRFKKGHLAPLKCIISFERQELCPRSRWGRLQYSHLAPSQEPQPRSPPFRPQASTVRVLLLIPPAAHFFNNSTLISPYKYRINAIASYTCTF